MKTKHILALCTAFLAADATYGQYNTMKFNSIRMVRWSTAVRWAAADGPGGEFDTWLNAVAAQKYNYVVVAMEDYGPDPQITTIAELKEPMKNVYARVSRAGLRLIPEIPIGSPASRFWRRFNPSIQWNAIRFPDLMESPSYAPHAAGIDKSLDEMFTTIKSAYQESNPGYPFEFVYMNYDEFAHGYVNTANRYILPGGAPLNSNAAISHAEVDRQYINAYQGGTAPSEAVNNLVLSSIVRRTKRLQALVSQSAKVFTYADVWDPQANGGFTYRNFLNINTSFATGIQNLPGLTTSDRDFMKANVILVPWNYFDRWPNHASSSYSASATFNYFRNSGFKFLYAAGIHVGDPAYKTQGINAMKKYVSACGANQGNCLGYSAVWWSQQPVGEIRLELFNENQGRGYIPTNSFKYDDSPIVTYVTN